MSLAGFNHVFAKAVEIELAPGERIRVAPPLVTTLLKIIAYVEDPYRRAKDLQDIQLVFANYLRESDRLFSDEVFDANLPDFSMVNAFLLGRDLRELASNEDARHIRKFLAKFEEQDVDLEDYSGRQFRNHLLGLQQGFAGT